jgi:hypothetical protein
MKLNKQGVRDLGHAPKTKVNSGLASLPPLMTQEEAAIVREHFGKNQLPGEMAAKLLEGQAEFGAPLAPEVEEFLHILAEECAETIQRVTKVLRFGPRRNPWDGKDSVERLESEIGDVCAALDVLELLGLIDSDRVHDHTTRKLRAFVVEENPAKPRLRHATAELRAKIQGLL